MSLENIEKSDVQHSNKKPKHKIVLTEKEMDTILHLREAKRKIREPLIIPPYLSTTEEMYRARLRS